MGSSLSASLTRGALTLLKPITPGSPHSGCEGGSQPREPSSQLPSALLDRPCSVRDDGTAVVDELNMENMHVNHLASLEELLPDVMPADFHSRHRRAGFLTLVTVVALKGHMQCFQAVLSQRIWCGESVTRLLV